MLIPKTTRGLGEFITQHKATLTTLTTTDPKTKVIWEPSVWTYIGGKRIQVESIDIGDGQSPFITILEIANDPSETIIHLIHFEKVVLTYISFNPF